MTLAQLADLVSEGIDITQRIARLEQRREQIATQLRTYALQHPARHEPLAQADREGRQCLVTGARGEVLPILVKADQIAATFADGGDAHKKISAAAARAGASLAPFYAPKVTWRMVPKDGATFRKEASGLLGDAAGPFVEACLRRDKDGLPISAITVEWAAASGANPGALAAAPQN